MMTWKRAAILVLLVLAIAFVAVLDSTYDAVHSLYAWAERIVAAHEPAGVILFVLLSALSAMLAFFSTAIFVPVAVEAWGKLFTVLLLWIGWLIGGSLSYCIGRYFGRPVVHWFISDQKLRPYEYRLAGRVSFRHLLLFQLALPSEIPGYVLGILRYPIGIYAAALMIAEFPFAVGSVYLGEGFLQRNPWMLIGIGFGGVLIMLFAGSAFHRLFAGRSGGAHPA